MSESEEPVSKLIGQIENRTLKTRAVDETPIGITIADMREEDEPLIYVNEAFERITGYTEAETIGRNCRFLQGSETEPEPVARMREAIENEASVQVELRNYRKGGEQFWCEVTLAPLENEQGETTHYVGFQQDVSKRKEYEKRLEQQRDDLSILNEMMRHDIRNDLQVALASMEVLESQNEYEPEQLQTAISGIHGAIELTNMARDVAEVMLESGADYRPVALTEVLQDKIQETRSSFPEATVSISGTLPAVSVQANDLLASLFRNLLANAIHHNETGQPEVVVSAAVEDGDVVVMVADNGPGVSETGRDHLFEKGWTSTESDGTGIGLYLVSRLVDDYGGEISLFDNGDPVAPEMDLGGATFVVRLPVVE